MVHKFHVDESNEISYEMIMGIYLFTFFGIGIKFLNNILEGGEGPQDFLEKRRGSSRWNLHSAKSEYGRALYCDATNSGPVRGSAEGAGGTGRYVVVVIGGT